MATDSDSWMSDMFDFESFMNDHKSLRMELSDGDSLDHDDEYRTRLEILANQEPAFRLLSSNTSSNPNHVNANKTYSLPELRSEPSRENIVTIGKRKKSRTVLSKAAKSVLQEWLCEHISDPYPSKGTKTALAQEAGLTIKQVSTWLCNNRKRKLLKKSNLSEARMESNSKVEEWISSSSEDEDIVRAALQQESPMIGAYGSFSDQGGEWTGSGLDSIGSTVSSAFSQCSFAMKERPARRGLRRHRKTAVRHESPMDSSLSSRNFQCTFCHQYLSEKAWKRHEETVHLPKRKWICMKNEPSAQNHYNCGSPFCHNRCWASALIQPHCKFRNIHECSMKPECDRSFFRKDQLLQHFRSLHGVGSMAADHFNELADFWEEEIKYDAQVWYCGFCGQILENWDVRATHIAAHFRQGLDMSDWSDSSHTGTTDSIQAEPGTPVAWSEQLDPVPPIHWNESSTSLDWPTIDPSGMDEPFTIEPHQAESMFHELDDIAMNQ